MVKFIYHYLEKFYIFLDVKEDFTNPVSQNPFLLLLSLQPDDANLLFSKFNDLIITHSLKYQFF